MPNLCGQAATHVGPPPFLAAPFLAAPHVGPPRFLPLRFLPFLPLALTLAMRSASLVSVTQRAVAGSGDAGDATAVGGGSRPLLLVRPAAVPNTALRFDGGLIGLGGSVHGAGAAAAAANASGSVATSSPAPSSILASGFCSGGGCRGGGAAASASSFGRGTVEGENALGVSGPAVTAHSGGPAAARAGWQCWRSAAVAAGAPGMYDCLFTPLRVSQHGQCWG